MTTVDAIRSFEAAVRKRGIIPPPAGIVADGIPCRCAVEGTPHKKDGTILLYGDSPISGGFQNWRDGLGWQNWTWGNGNGNGSGNGARLSAEEVREAKARQEKIHQARDQERADRANEAAADARKIWEAAGPASPSQPYLMKKKIKPNTLRMSGDGILIVPMTDESGSLVNLQRINGTGEKRFLPGGKVAGTFSSFGPPPDPSGSVVIVEGVSTGLSVVEAAGLPVVSAMSADNLLAVAKTFRARYPKAILILFADHDTKETHGHTQGIEKAMEAAKVTSGLIAISPTPGDDANDLYAREGAGAVKAAVGAARAVTVTSEAAVVESSSILSENRDYPSASKWPAPPGEAAFHGLAGEFVHLVEPVTEGDPVAILAQFLVMFGNMLGRGPFVPIEADRHHTNLFAAIVGVTSKGRKGISAGQARRPLATVDEEWVRNRVTGGLSSGEGLIWGVRDPIERQEPIKTKGRIDGYQTVIEDQGETDKRLMVMETELASTIRVLGRDGNTLSATIRQAWDSGDLRILTKKSPARATDAHISIIGHITKQELLRYLDATEKGNGFANRFLWVCAKRSKFLPRGGKQINFDPFLRQLSTAVDFTRRVGVAPVTWDDEAGAYWDSIYPRLSSGGVGMAAEVTSRAEAQVLRLSLVYALLNQSDKIRLPHLLAAEAFWKYCEASVRFIFGSKLGDPVADEILGELQKAGATGRTRSEIREFFGRNLRSEEIGRALGMLQEQGIAYCKTDDQTGGRPAERWYATTGGASVPEDDAWEDGRE